MRKKGERRGQQIHTYLLKEKTTRGKYILCELGTNPRGRKFPQLRSMEGLKRRGKRGWLKKERKKKDEGINKNYKNGS